MIHEILLLISEMEVDISRTKRLIDFSSTYFSAQDIARKERVAVLEIYVPKLKLLLNEQPEAITGGSHFCKHDVGGSTAEKESTSLATDASDTPGETQAVGGNKQMQKFCECNGGYWQMADGMRYCSYCRYPLAKRADASASSLVS